MKTKPQLFFDSAEFIDKVITYSKYEPSFLKQMQRFYNSSEALKLSNQEFLALDYIINIAEAKK